jgi:hypothetical protein
MADNLQNGLTQLRDILYTTDSDHIKEFPNLSFNRDEFIFLLKDKTTKLVSCSDKKFVIRTGKTDLMKFIDVDGTWTMHKYDDSAYAVDDTEMVWLKGIVDDILLSISFITDKDASNDEYESLMSRIDNDQV